MNWEFCRFYYSHIYSDLQQAKGHQTTMPIEYILVYRRLVLNLFVLPETLGDGDDPI